MLKRHRRRAVSMKRLDGFQPPGLAFFSLRLCPDNCLPVWGQNQTRAGVRQLYAVASRLPDIEEEGTLNRMLMRACLNVNAIFQEDVSRAQNLFPRVGGPGHMMQASVTAAVLFGAGQIVSFIIDGEPAAADTTVIQLNRYPAESSRLPASRGRFP